MGLELKRYTDVTAFRQAIDDYLLANINICSQIFSITRNLTDEFAHDHQAWMVALNQAGETCGVAMITTPLPLRLLSLSPIDEEGAALIAEAMKANGIKSDGVIGVGQGPARMTQAMDVQTEERVRLGNHVLDTSPEIFQCKGLMRAATMADHDMLLAWESAFVVECGLPDNRATLPAEIKERLSSSVPLMWVWEVEGTPVAMALGRPCLPIARLGMVYTVPEHRGYGYAGALVGRLSADLQARGCKSVFLFTDLANSTSNAIYRRIGYRLLDEFVHLNVL